MFYTNFRKLKKKYITTLLFFFFTENDDGLTLNFYSPYIMVFNNFSNLQENSTT